MGTKREEAKESRNRAQETNTFYFTRLLKKVQPTLVS